MYVLFNNYDDFACGISDKIKPFTSGLFIDDVSGLKKEYVYTRQANKYNARHEQLYLNKDGAVTTNPINNVPLTETINNAVLVSISEKPEIFTKVDVLKFKQAKMLHEFDKQNCMMYEFNLDKFIDISRTEQCMVGVNDIVIAPGGLCITKPLPISKEKLVKICVDSSDRLNVLYSFNGDGFAKTKKEIISTEDVIYVCFKNNTKETVALYGFQILF